MSVYFEPYATLVSHYREARDAWRDSIAIRESAGVLGMSEREYCDRYITRFGPIIWTSVGDTPTLDADAAFEEAGR